MYAFVSYQTADRVVAGRAKAVLESLKIPAFLAHEDIHVSEEWRLKILEELGKASTFVALLSEHYYSSVWCVQESGIAAFRSDLLIVPLSLDGNLPKGFLGHIQSTKVDPDNIYQSGFFPALAKTDPAFVIDTIIDIIAGSGSFRGAEANFKLILPFLPRATDDQVVRLLNVAAANGEIHHATLCARNYLPPLVASHGHLLDADTRALFGNILPQYAALGIGR